jgi:hypothetical protein
MRERKPRWPTGEAIEADDGAELTNIETGKISLAPELSDIWR